MGSITAPPKVLLIDGDAFIRSGLRMYLQCYGLFILEAGDEQTGWQEAITHKPQLAIIDVVLPNSPNAPFDLETSRGIHLTLRLKEKFPTMGIIIFSAYGDRASYITDLIHKGTRGLAYKLKGCLPSELLQTVYDVLAGKVVIDKEVIDSRSVFKEAMARLTKDEKRWVELVISRIPILSPREKEITALLAKSHTIKNIAQTLGIEHKTVEGYVTRIYEKLGLTEMANETPRRQPVMLAKAYFIYQLKYDPEIEPDDEEGEF